MSYRDAHTHLSGGAWELSDLDVRALRRPEELHEAVARAAQDRPEGRWIRAWGWAGGAPREDASPGHPLWLVRADGHAAWLNGAGRAALGVPSSVQCVEERVFDAVRRRLPPPDDGEREAAIERRVGELAACGIGVVDDVVEGGGPPVWARLAERGLALGVGLWLPAATTVAQAERWRGVFPPGRGGVEVRGIKIFLDGTLRARTAALTAPYADAPGGRGELRMSAAELLESARGWAARGYPVAIHAIGDRAVSIALDALERVPRPAWGAHRIEHAQVVARRDLPRFARAGIVASLQPGHREGDAEFLSLRLGPGDGLVVHGLASFLAAGATVVLGSDWPVSTWSPGAIVAAACDPARGAEAIPESEARRLLSA